MVDGELKILETCPLCGKKLETKEEPGDHCPPMIEQNCDCGFRLNFYPAHPVWNEGCWLEISILGGKKNMETILERIVTPVPPVMSELDLIKTILDIVRELEKEYGTAEKEAIELRAYREYGVDPHTTREIIARLKTRAELYEPRHGHYKIV